MDLKTMGSIAVDLDSPRSIQRAKQRRGRKQAISATIKARIDAETARAERRIRWLERKALHLRINSNGRDKTIKEAVVLRLLLTDLANRPKSRAKGTAYSAFGFKRANKLAMLLNELVPEQ